MLALCSLRCTEAFTHYRITENILGVKILMMMMISVHVQMVSEKVGGAEGTKLDEEFKDLEKVRLLKCYLFSFIFEKSDHFLIEEFW